LGVVSPDIFAMPGELDGEAAQGRLVSAGQIAQYEAARLDMPFGHATEDFGIEITGEDAVGHGLLVLRLDTNCCGRRVFYAAGFSYFLSAGTASISISISFSLFTPAACAA